MQQTQNQLFKYKLYDVTVWVESRHMTWLSLLVSTQIPDNAKCSSCFFCLPHATNHMLFLPLFVSYNFYGNSTMSHVIKRHDDLPKGPKPKDFKDLVSE